MSVDPLTQARREERAALARINEAALAIGRENVKWSLAKCQTEALKNSPELYAPYKRAMRRRAALEGGV